MLQCSEIAARQSEPKSFGWGDTNRIRISGSTCATLRACRAHQHSEENEATAVIQSPNHTDPDYAIS
jgi:hypothetical protein